MNIREIAGELNSLANNHRIGDLQKIRKDIKGLKRIPSKNLFHDSTISDDGWAFHYGGRKELQFNIGFEEEGFRYGIAFSLETSRSLPDVSILFPKILKLNCIIRENTDYFNDYKMWVWQGKERSDIMPVVEIINDFIRPNTFIFIGKLVKDIELEDVLSTFDSLLDVYIQIESDSNASELRDILNNNKFKFDRTNTKLVINRKLSSKEKEINITVRHSFLQKSLYQELSKKYGSGNISVENPWNGNRIDIVVKTDKGYIFYEIKVASSAKSCIREALGQIFEYAFWPGFRHAKEIVIAGEHPLDADAKNYVEFLHQEFSLPLKYKEIKI